MISSISPKVVSVSVTFWGCPSRWSTCWDGPGRCRWDEDPLVFFGDDHHDIIAIWSIYHHYIIHETGKHAILRTSTSWLSSIYHPLIIYHPWSGAPSLLTNCWFISDATRTRRASTKSLPSMLLRGACEKPAVWWGTYKVRPSSFNLGYEPH